MWPAFTVNRGFAGQIFMVHGHVRDVFLNWNVFDIASDIVILEPWGSGEFKSF